MNLFNGHVTTPFLEIIARILSLKNQITPSLNNITVESSSITAMASLHYQYLEVMDKVEKSSNGITVERKLIVGDTIKLRDNRSMALEPVDQISSYVYNGSI